MRKFTLDAWDRHIANIQIEGYGQGLAKAKMMAMVHALRILSVYDGVLIGYDGNIKFKNGNKLRNVSQNPVSVNI